MPSLAELHEEDSAALDEYMALQSTARQDLKPLRDNPLNTTCKITREGNKVTKRYSGGPDKIQVVGDPYLTFAKGPADIPL